MNKNPWVSILMAVYNPDMIWLEQQLCSINNQTYKNIELIICDDCSEKSIFEQVQKLIGTIIIGLTCTVIRNQENKGSNTTFELLTNYARGEFIAYCDQDDIWEEDKISILLEAFNDIKATMAYSDMSIIDSEGRKIAESITKVRSRFSYYQGGELWRKVLIRNFISGCCLMIRTETAKHAIPFMPGMQHDRWLAICAAIEGEIAFVNKPLVRYRQHNNNQTGVLRDVTDKQSYYRIRLFEHKAMLESIRIRFKDNPDVRLFLDKYISNIQARCDYYNGKWSALFKMIWYIHQNPGTTIFEIIALKLPDLLFKKLLKVITG